MLLQWRQKITRGGHITYMCAVDPTGRWDGDEWGNEWTCGFAIYEQDQMFTLYEDDGCGNGDAIGDYPTLSAAMAAAESYVGKTRQER